MIELNLFPQEQRKQRTKFDLGLRQDQLTYVIAGVVGILIIIHFFLMGVVVIKGVSYRRINTAWQKIQPEKSQVDTYKKENTDLEKRIKAIDSIISKDRIIWSRKLNEISDIIPSGVWLKWVILQSKHLTLEGSSVSRQGNEIISVNKFSTALKENKEFFKDFGDLEVSSIKRRNIKNIEIVDFIINAYLR